jgi:hypothetical protein
MPAHPFTLRQVDQARGDLYAIQDDLDFIKVQLARLPTRNLEVWRAAVARHDRRRGGYGDADRGALARLQIRLANMNIDLTDEEAAALLRELNNIVENDRYPLSPRIRTLREIRAKLPGAPAAPPPTRAPRTGRPRR